jgi:kynurenine formamidase
MTVLALLSHRLRPEGPNWPDAPGMVIDPCHRMDAGDIANTHVIHVYSHYGTHVDVPYHFISDGASLTDLGPDDFVFDAPVVIDVPLGDDELMERCHLEVHADVIAEADLLLVRSGFEAFRDDRQRYERSGPGFSVEAALRLREFAPRLRAVALDWLSLCAFAHVDAGVLAHRILLAAPAPVLIYEDVALSALQHHRPVRVWAPPLFIDGLDGSPVTMIAEVDA